MLGGGGYTIRNVARCWTYETAVALNCEIANGEGGRWREREIETEGGREGRREIQRRRKGGREEGIKKRCREEIGKEGGITALRRPGEKCI